MTDYREEVERLEACQQEAGRYFADATRKQKAEYDARMAFIRPWSGSPRWDRQRAAADKRWKDTTVEARALQERTVAELMATGEVGENLYYEWDQLEVTTIMHEVAA